MQRKELIDQLNAYFVKNVLDGRDIGLSETTPLLEWGIINSLEIVRLLNYIDEQFGIEISYADLTPANFTDISSIVEMILVSPHP